MCNYIFPAGTLIQIQWWLNTFQEQSWQNDDDVDDDDDHDHDGYGDDDGDDDDDDHDGDVLGDNLGGLMASISRSEFSRGQLLY